MASIAGSPPSNKTEKRVFDSLARQLDDSWLLASNVSYLKKGSNAEGELDLFLAHERYGIFVIEVKGGRLERDSNRGWLHWNKESQSMEPTNAFKQVQSAKRNLVDYLQRERLHTGFLPATPYVIFADIKRPQGPLGPDAESLLIFGDEIDSLSKKLQSVPFESAKRHFELRKLSQILFPTVKTLPYVPPAAGTLDLNALEQKLADISKTLKKVATASTTEKLATDVGLLHKALSLIQESSPVSNPTNESEVSEIARGLEGLQHQMAQLLENQRSVGSDSPSSQVGVRQIGDEILAMRQAIEGFASRVDAERQEQVSKVEVDLTSVEELLVDLKKMVSRAMSPTEKRTSQESLAPILSSLGILSARMVQLSQAVDNGAIPLTRFDAKLDRLAEMYREINDRVDQSGIDQGTPGFADEIRREMKVMQQTLTELSRRPVGAVYQSGTAYKKRRQGRVSSAIVAGIVAASLAVGAVAVAGLFRGAEEGQITESPGSEATVQKPTPTVTAENSSGSSTSVSVASTSVLQTTTSGVVVGSTVALPIVSSSTTVKRPSTTQSVSTSVVSPATQVPKKVSPITVASPTTSKIQISTRVVVAKVEFGEKHSCVLSTEGAVFCWGDNSIGQLGAAKGASTFSATPLKVEFQGARIVALSAGRFHTCALSSESNAYCWGSNAVGQLGVDSSDYGIAYPVEVAGGLRFASISAGGLSTCGVTLDGRGFCWGRNADNELGSDVGYSSLLPVEISGGWRFKMIEAGESAVACGIEIGGRLLCWGDGDDEFGPIERNLYDMRFGESIMGVGADHVCLVQGGVDLRCISWYTNDVLGVGDNRESMGRSRGALPEALVALSPGFRQTCGLTSDGRAYCWGARPTLVKTDQRFVSLAVRGTRQCGVTANGDLYCWGFNADGLGGTRAATSEPALVQLNAYS